MTTEELKALAEAGLKVGGDHDLWAAVLALIVERDDAMTVSSQRSRQHTAAVARAEAAEAKIAPLEQFATGQRESFERTRPLCPDHRDKQTGKQCLACLREAAERRADAAEAKLAEVERQRDEAEGREKSQASLIEAEEGRAAAESREKALAAENKGLREALADARAALNRDRTGLAAALNQIRSELKGWRWLRPAGDGDEGGTWGSHPVQAHTQATLRQEIAWAFNSVLRIAAEALRASGRLADEGCRQADAALAAGNKET